jgi:YD repeat-containing protein
MDIALKQTNVFLVMLFFSFQMASSQYNFNVQLENAIKVTNSPEAMAFTKYGDVSANLYTGTPNIAVPLHTIEGKELDFPISLTYDATGIKVEQLATQSGLGWNLNTGGRISRMTNGFPDDVIHTTPAYYSFWNNNVRDKMLAYIEENNTFDSDQKVRNYFYFLKDVNTNKFDTQPDYFSLNAIGINDVIVFDIATRLPRTLNNPRIKVEFSQDTTTSINSWTVTDEDGTKYFFNLAEETDYLGDDSAVLEPTGAEIPYGLFKKYNSSWVLTKIETPNKKDIYELSYTDLGFWSQPQPTCNVQTIRNGVDDGNLQANDYPVTYGSPSYFYSTYNIKQKFLSAIYYNGHLQVSINLKSRLDISLASAIDNITFHKEDLGSSIYKTITFNHSYFGNINATLFLEKKVRLKLDGLTISVPNSIEVQKYHFDYGSGDIPPRDSMSQDYLGYYNGADNTVLYPSITIGEDLYRGANRKPNFEYAKRGILTKITYPTGGSTNFEYEPHKTVYDGSEDVMTDIPYGELSILGGVTGPGEFGPTTNWINDMYSDLYPKVAYSWFQVETAANFNISFARTTPSTGSISPVIRILYRVAGFIPGNPCPSRRLNTVINLSTGIPYNSANIIAQGEGLHGNFFLQPGCYAFAIIDGTEGSSCSMVAMGRGLESHGVIGHGEFARAGIRIKSIKDYSKEGELASDKEYKYTKEIDNPDSSGEIQYYPQLSYPSSAQVYFDAPANPTLPDQGVRTVQYMNRTSSGSGGDTPPIGYSTVFEIKKSVINQTASNGYTRYDFNNTFNPPFGYGVSTLGLPPFENYYSKHYELGKEKFIKKYDEVGDLLESTEFQYKDDNFYINKGIFLRPNSGMTYQYPKVIDNGNGQFTYQFIPARFSCLQGSNPTDWSTVGNCNHLNAQPCDEPGCINDPTLASCSNMAVTTAAGRIGDISKIIRQEFLPSGTVVQTTTNNFYGAAGHYLLKETISNIGTANEVKNTFYYPVNFPVPVYQGMEAENRLNVKVLEETYKNSEKTASMRTNFFHDYSCYNVSDVEISKGAGSFERRIVYEDYDLNGNLYEYSIGDAHTVLLWGYNDKYPIAKIENATVAKVKTALGVSRLDLINEAQLSQINNLRNNPLMADSMITTYTYIPHVGVSTITKPNGDITTYDYDAFNRLKSVKDKDGNILSENEYHFKP